MGWMWLRRESRLFINPPLSSYVVLFFLFYTRHVVNQETKVNQRTLLKFTVSQSGVIIFISWRGALSHFPKCLLRSAKWTSETESRSKTILDGAGITLWISSKAKASNSPVRSTETTRGETTRSRRKIHHSHHSAFPSSALWADCVSAWAWVCRLEVNQGGNLISLPCSSRSRWLWCQPCGNTVACPLTCRVCAHVCVFVTVSWLVNFFCPFNPVSFWVCWVH